MKKALPNEFVDMLSGYPEMYHETTNPIAQRTMPSFTETTKVMHYWLKEQIGSFSAFKVLLKSFTWDMVFKKPKWYPDRFPIEGKEDEKIWKEAFYNDVVFFVTISNNLKRKYGEIKGDEIMAKFIMPIGLHYHFMCFKPIENHTHIDQLRQQMADYLGDGKTMSNRVWVSEKGNACQYYYSKCIHVQLMCGYGMKRSAQGSCLIDHITFDKRVPSVKFKRTKILSNGDSYCDHHFSVREEGDQLTPYEYYEDAHRADFDAYSEIMKLEKLYDMYGPTLRPNRKKKG